MCKELCDIRDDMQSCQDCGTPICFDVETGDDVIRPAYVTASGDLYCRPCGRGHDLAEIEQEEADREAWEEESYLDEFGHQGHDDE